MQNKLALITGGTRGIGKAISIELAKKGYDIVSANMKNREDALEEMRKYGVRAEFFACDISDGEDRQRLVDYCISEFGAIDVLVNNAGVAPKVRMDILETTEESLDFVLGINLKGTFFLTQLVARAMIDKIENEGLQSPKIVNIASISSYTSSTARAEYCISKAGVSMMTKLYADRLARYGIMVYEVRPGIIKTDMTEAVTEKYDKMFADGITPIARWGLPEDVGRAVAALCGDDFLYSTGQIIDVDGGFHIRRL